MTRTRKPTAMPLTINDTTMAGDHTAHTARQSARPRGTDGSSPGCPARVLDRNTAITAMILADTAGRRRPA